MPIDRESLSEYVAQLAAAVDSLQVDLSVVSEMVDEVAGMLGLVPVEVKREPGRPRHLKVVDDA